MKAITIIIFSEVGLHNYDLSQLQKLGGRCSSLIICYFFVAPNRRQIRHEFKKIKENKINRYWND